MYASVSWSSSSYLYTRTQGGSPERRPQNVCYINHTSARSSKKSTKETIRGGLATYDYTISYEGQGKQAGQFDCNACMRDVFVEKFANISRSIDKSILSSDPDNSDILRENGIEKQQQHMLMRGSGTVPRSPTEASPVKPGKLSCVVGGCFQRHCDTRLLS
jgi:hypothetical protein